MVWVLVGAVVAAGGWGILLFNGLVRQRNLMGEGWSLIEVQLKKRHDLIPRLVETVKAYAAHERGVLEEIARRRGGGNVAEEETALSGALKNLLVLAEAYPDLKADQNYRAFQQELVEVEDQLEMARRYYNGTVRNYNIAVQSFPSNVIAGGFGFSAGTFFEIELATERQTPQVKV